MPRGARYNPDFEIADKITLYVVSHDGKSSPVSLLTTIPQGWLTPGGVPNTSDHAAES
jgi:hypothetical protein